MLMVIIEKINIFERNLHFENTLVYSLLIIAIQHKMNLKNC